MQVGSALRTWWERWRFRKRLTSLEQWVIARVSEQLPTIAQSILAQQVRNIQSIYRDYQSGEVLLYRHRDQGAPPFPNRQLECKWTTLHLHCSRNPLKGRVRLYLVRGYLFTLHFSPPDLMQAQPGSLVIDRVQFHADVMETVEAEAEAGVPAEAIPSHIPNWLAQLGQTYPLREFRAPLDAKRRTHRLATIGSQVPADYLALLEICDGFTIGEIAVLGAGEVYSVALPGGEHWVIALCGDRFLTVKEGDASAAVYYFHHEDLEPRASFASLEQALCYFLLRCDSVE